MIVGDAPEGPLAGVRVLDLTSVIMGPLATQILGDLGADVITIERREGDTSRRMGVGPHPELSGIAMNLLRNKRNVALDIATTSFAFSGVPFPGMIISLGLERGEGIASPDPGTPSLLALRR